MNLSAGIKIPLPQKKISPFFHGLESWFRLNPQWEVLSIKGASHIKKGDRFGLEVRYDRTEDQVTYEGVVEELIDGLVLSVRLDAEKSRHITIHFEDKGGASILRQEEDMEKEERPMEDRDLTPWLKSVAWYIMLQNKKTPWSKFWKFFMDRLWLKMSPSGRRIVLLVVIAEALGFMLFLLFLVAHYAGL